MKSHPAILPFRVPDFGPKDRTPLFTIPAREVARAAFGGMSITIFSSDCGPHSFWAETVVPAPEERRHQP